MLEPFIYDICQFIAANSGGMFTFGTGDTNLKIAELVRGQDGVYAVSNGSPEPDLYTAVTTYSIDFFASNKNSATAFQQLQTIYNIFDRRENFSTANFEVYASYPGGQIDDLDRDGENSKILRLSVIFISSRIALVS